jgi:formate hydrogenlyase subunit 6/NADH:ubiquinone oxidoreductase subunit I
MAYFSNSTDGSVFDYQCSLCKYGEEPCPIAFVQMEYNYEACNNKTARGILDSLVKDDGTCEMFRQFEKDFSLEKQQKESPSLFEVVFGENNKSK